MATRVERRRIAITAACMLGGAILLAVIALLGGAPGYAVGMIGIAGGGVGVLIGLAVAGAIEDGEVQRASDRARGGREGPAQRP